jgi:hypothetical protein
MTARRRDVHAIAVGAVTAALLLWAWMATLKGPYQFDDYVTPLGDPASQSLTAWGHYLPVTLRRVLAVHSVQPGTRGRVQAHSVKS